MLSLKRVISVFAIVSSLTLLSFAADKKSKDTKAAETSKPSYELPQPATRNSRLRHVSAHPR